MSKIARLVAGVVLASAASTALATGTPPVINSACVSFPKAGVARISGLVTDADWDARTVAPLVVGVCLSKTPNVIGTSYYCDVPSNAGQVTLVAADAQNNFSGPRYVKIQLGCTYY